MEVAIVAMLRFTRISPLWCLRDRLAQVSGDLSLTQRERERERKEEVGEKEERGAGKWRVCVGGGGERERCQPREIFSVDVEK